MREIVKVGRNRLLEFTAAAQLEGYRYYIAPVKSFGTWMSYIGRSAPAGMLKPFIAVPADGVCLFAQRLEYYFKKEESDE